MVNLIITNSYEYKGDLIKGFAPLSFKTAYFFDESTRYYVFAKDYPRAGRSRLPHPIVGGIKERIAEELKLEFKDSVVLPGIPVKESVIRTGKAYKICTECPPWGNIIAFILGEAKRVSVFPKMGSVSMIAHTPSPHGGMEVILKLSAKSLFYLLQHDGMEGEAFLASWEAFGLRGRLEIQALG